MWCIFYGPIQYGALGVEEKQWRMLYYPMGKARAAGKANKNWWPRRPRWSGIENSKEDGLKKRAWKKKGELTKGAGGDAFGGIFALLLTIWKFIRQVCHIFTNVINHTSQQLPMDGDGDGWSRKAMQILLQGTRFSSWFTFIALALVSLQSFMSLISALRWVSVSHFLWHYF